MDKPKVTPKDFFLWAGAMVALYWSVIAFILLFFNYISYAFPDPLSYLSPNPYDSGIGNEMAAIVVLFPIYAILMRLIRRDIVRDHARADIWVRRWALILTLFVAGAAMAGDLISLLAAFFTGEELTLSFLLKSLLLLSVAAIAFMHFIADYWGYWEKNEARKRMVCYSVAALAAFAVVAGFVMFGTPYQARQYRYDEQRVSDLQEIQSHIVTYWQAKETLPPTLAELNDPLGGFTVPTDVQTGAAYEYATASARSFKLCATFNAMTQTYGASDARTYPMAPVAIGAKGTPISDNWWHDAGHQCFDRTIDPQLYSPLSKLVPAK